MVLLNHFQNTPICMCWGLAQCLALGSPALTLHVYSSRFNPQQSPGFNTRQNKANKTKTTPRNMSQGNGSHAWALPGELVRTETSSPNSVHLWHMRLCMSDKFPRASEVALVHPLYETLL